MIRNQTSIRSLLIRAVSLLTVAAMLLCNPLIPTERAAVATVSAVEEDKVDVDELKDKKEELEAEQERLESERDKEQAKLDKLEAEKADLETQIEEKIAEIDKKQVRVDELDAQIGDKAHEIGKKQQAIDNKEAELSDEFEDLRVRMRAVAKTGSLTTTLGLIMNAENYSDYLVKSKATQCIAEQNREVMDALEAELQEINTAKAALEEEKAAMEEELAPIAAEQAKLQQAKLELDSLYSQKAAKTDEINQNIEKYNADIKQHEEDAAELQKEINKAIAKNYNNGVYNQSGTMLWPAPYCNYISSTFKWRWGRQHAGIDICGGGCYGTDILAAADGVVSLAGWCGGYGYCVMIDHGTNSNGKNVTTVYGHAARQPSVSVGQSVSAGDPIAVIGSTGNSTGPHLHFEVRVGGSAVDPIANGYVNISGITVNESL